MAGDDGAAENFAGFLVVVNPRETFLLAVKNRAVHMVQRLGNRRDIETRRFGILLIVTDMGDFGIGICTPRHRQIGNLTAGKNKCVGYDDARHGIGGMGEFEFRTDIAGGKYARVRSAQPGIDFDSSRRVAYSGCFQVESFQIGCAADRKQDGVATEFGRDPSMAATRFFHGHFWPRAESPLL